MRVVLVHDGVFPVHRYGGTERIVWWLAKGLSSLGVEVTLLCRRGSAFPYGKMVPLDPHRPWEEQIPEGDIFHSTLTPRHPPERPYLVTIHGNGKVGEGFLPNTVFLSRNHAERHGGRVFVYNGVDPDDYDFQSHKNSHLLFLAKAAWRVKNVRGAIRIARASGRPLDIAGGARWWFPRWRGVHWRGMVGGALKRRLLAESSGLLFPVLWHEPFGVAVVEALLSGTPVLASPFGSLPELVTGEVGRVCRSEREFREGVESLGEYSPRRCREWALDRFHYLRMTEGYVKLYEEVLSGGNLNAGPLPGALQAPQDGCRLEGSPLR